MNDKTIQNNPPLLTEEELDALLQRKAAIQARLKTGGSAAAGTCSTSSSPVACPGCGCGIGGKALATEKSRLFKPTLAVLVMAAVILLLWRMSSAAP